jgi:hypothetical protein
MYFGDRLCKPKTETFIEKLFYNTLPHYIDLTRAFFLTPISKSLGELSS